MIQYVLQDRNFALGNFINLTPTIRYLYDWNQERVPVFFETEYVRQCFLNCPFIEILYEKPAYAPLLTSATINANDDKPDYQYIFEISTGCQWTPKYHTYVDFIASLKTAGVMLLNGSGSQNADYIAKKDVGRAPYQFAVDYICNQHKIFSAGSYEDLARAPYMAQLADEACWNDIRKTLLMMSASKCIIANDTGLAHAAGAMNKPLLVLWKDTPRERCKNAGQNTVYSYKNHEQNIKAFLDAYT